MPQCRSKTPSAATKTRHSQKKKKEKQRSQRQKVEVLDFMFPLGMRVCSVTKLCPTLCHPMDCTPPGFSAHGIFQAGKNAGVGCHFLLQGIFLIEPESPASPALAGRFFTTEPPGKPFPLESTVVTSDLSSV